VLGGSVWQMLLFLINGAVFILIGLQMPAVLASLSARPLGELLALGALISATVILVRIGWMFPATYLPRRLSRRLRERDPAPPRRAIFVLSWAGMRGVVSLAAALALPLDFPQRDLIIFLTFCVILATLVGQGLTLPPLITRLQVGDDGSGEHEEGHARTAAAEAAVRTLDELALRWPDHLELIDQLRAGYAHRAQHIDPHREDADGTHDRELEEHREIRLAVISAEREAILDLRDRGVIGDEALRTVERDLDLEELRMEA
jgi:CPA1 family monovalent cation:H+ antiporter